MTKKAIITGVTGQDGAYLSEFLLKKGYEVHGIKRRSSLFNTERIDHLYQDPHVDNRNFILHYGDLTDSTNLIRIIKEVEPDEIYNLGAMSHVKVSFDAPEYTADVDGVGTLRILEAVRLLGFEKKTRIYQASTSELYGLVQEVPQSETTPFYPRSPYGVAKLYGFWITVNYREAYDMYACNGILFNHESPLRGTDFITRKVTKGLAKWKKTGEHTLVGNLDAVRDWGHAEDFVEGMVTMMNMKRPDDYVLATGQTHTVRQWIDKCLEYAGIKPSWVGNSVSDYATGRLIFKSDTSNYRPAEVDILKGDAKKARTVLNWKPKHTFDSLVKDMVDADMRRYG